MSVFNLKSLATSLLLLSVVVVVSCAVANVQRKDFKEVSVLSYNIHHANPPTKPGFIDVDAIVRVIRDSRADIIALQEVDVLTGRSGKINQAQVIAEKLGMNYYFFRAIDHDGGEYGLAILSRLPLKDARTYPLPQAQPAEDRILAVAQVKVGRQWVYIANTHLDATRSSENRIAQMQNIVEITAQLNKPVILCGDLNATPDSEPIQLLDRAFTRTCMDDCLPTIPQVNPRRTIDYIATRNLPWKQKLIEVIPERYASDHLPVKVVFELP